jgi:hypothetical protein
MSCLVKCAVSLRVQSVDPSEVGLDLKGGWGVKSAKPEGGNLCRGSWGFGVLKGVALYVAVTRAG